MALFNEKLKTKTKQKKKIQERSYQKAKVNKYTKQMNEEKGTGTKAERKERHPSQKRQTYDPCNNHVAS